MMTLMGVTLLIGVVSGIVALALAPRYGRDKVVGRALVGLVFCGLVLVGGVVGFVGGVRRAQERARLSAELDQSSASLTQLLERAAQGEDIAQQGIAGVARMGSILRKSAETSKEPDRSILLSLADVTDSAVEAMQAKDAGTRPFIDAGGISADGLNSREAIAARIEMARNARTATDRYEAAMGDLPAQLNKLMQDRQVPADRAATTASGYLKSFQLETIVELCRAQRGIFDGAIELLGLLESSYGRWTLIGADRTLQFVDGDLVQRYNEVLGRVQAGANEETAIQQRIAERRKKK
jgi:hypothetical protein